MVQVIDATGDASEFEQPVSLLQPWFGLVASSVRETELLAVEYAVNAARHELEALHHMEHARVRLQSGFPQDALDWFASMLHSLERAVWHWEQAVFWLNEYGDPQRASLYRPLFEQVVCHQQRLNALFERLQGQMARYAQEWGIGLPES